MKKVVLTFIGIILGIAIIPAFIGFALGLAGTVIGFLLEPRVMMVMILVLGIISLPGIIIGLLAKK